MNKRWVKTLVNSLHALVILVSLYSTLCAAVYEGKGGGTFEIYGILFGAVLLPIIVMDVIIWYTIKRNNSASIFFSDIIQIVVSVAATFIIFMMSMSVEDIKFIVVWALILLISIFTVILQKRKSR